MAYFGGIFFVYGGGGGQNYFQIPWRSPILYSTLLRSSERLSSKSSESGAVVAMAQVLASQREGVSCGRVKMEQFSVNTKGPLIRGSAR